MKTKIKIILNAILLLVVNIANAQSTSGFTQSFNNVWAYFQVGIVFIIVLTFAIGVVVVYNAKSSGNPDDFKKKLMSFIYGIVFLFVALGVISVIKQFATSATNVSF